MCVYTSTGLYFLIFDSARSAVQQRQLSASLDWACAPLAGAVAALATNPMDLVKTRLQVCATFHEHCIRFHQIYLKGRKKRPI